MATAWLTPTPLIFSVSGTVALIAYCIRSIRISKVSLADEVLGCFVRKFHASEIEFLCFHPQNPGIACGFWASFPKNLISQNEF
jgi:hypothetical protein